MRGKTILLGLLIIMSIFSVSAATLTIKSIPEHTVWVTIKDSSFESALVQPMQYPINNQGEVFIKYNLEERFTIMANLKNGDNYVLQSKFEVPYEPDEDVVIELYPEGYTPVIKESENTTITQDSKEENYENSSEITNQQQEDPANSSITGLLSSVENIKSYSNIIIGLVSIFVLIFIIALIYKKTRSLQKKISSLEKKIKKTERKAEKLRGKREGLIKLLKAQIVKQEEQLIRMRGGSVPEKNTEMPKEIASEKKEIKREKIQSSKGFAVNPHKKSNKKYKEIFFKKRFRK